MQLSRITEDSLLKQVTVIARSEDPETSYNPAVNFTSILQAAFTRKDPKSAIKLLNLTVFFAFLGSLRVKAAGRILVKLTPCYLIVLVETVVGNDETLEPGQVGVWAIPRDQEVVGRDVAQLEAVHRRQRTELRILDGQEVPASHD